MKREYGRNRYHSMSEKNKQRFKEYHKNSHKAQKQHKIFLSFFLYMV